MGERPMSNDDPQPCKHGVVDDYCGDCEEEMERAYDRSQDPNDTGCASVFELEEKP